MIASESMQHRASLKSNLTADKFRNVISKQKSGHKGDNHSEQIIPEEFEDRQVAQTEMTLKVEESHSQKGDDSLINSKPADDWRHYFTF